MSDPNLVEPGLVQERLTWFTAGESRLALLLAAAPDLRAPSLLPGWTRAHVVAHLIGNADALGNLVHWARTGEPTPMYADPQARAAQIDRDAQRPADWLFAQARAASGRLAAALAGLHPADWGAKVRTAQGRTVGAIEIPWLRIRESAIHALDLDVQAPLEQCAAPLIDALLTDAVATVGSREGCPSVEVAPDDRDRTWALGPSAPAATVTGTAAELLTWVVGRSVAAGRPVLPRWL